MEPPEGGGGLVDLQVNGYAGVDFNDAALTPDGLDHALAAMLRAGVICCLPTLITAAETTLADRFAALDRAVAGSRLGTLMVPGYHLEGPFLSPAPGYAGCHPIAAMRDPDPDLIERLGAGLRRPILLLTLAPELEGAGALIRRCRARGMLVALGHTAARHEAIEAAASAGASLSTHLGNAAAHVQAKFDNPIMAQLAEDRLAACFIADGIHVPRFALRAMIRAKGVGRSILVTDATAAAAAPPGCYRLAGMAIERLVDGTVRLPGGVTLAGSSLALDAAIRNVAAWGIAPAGAALRMASANPAAALRPALAAHGIVLAGGEVAWSDDLRPLRVRIGDFAVTPDAGFRAA